MAESTTDSRSSAATALEIGVFPVLVDPEQSTEREVAPFFDESLSRALGEDVRFKSRLILSEQLPKEFFDSAFTGFYNVVPLAQSFLAQNKAERYFCITMMSRPVNGIVSVYGWIIDRYTGRQIASSESSGGSDVSLGTRAVELAMKLHDSIVEAGLDGLLKPYLPWGRQLGERITFHSDLNGMEVSLPDRHSLGIVSKGVLVAFQPAVEVGQNLTVVLRKPGYYPVERNIKVDKARTEVNLGGLFPVRHYRIGLSWQANLGSSGAFSFTSFADGEYLFWTASVGAYVRPLKTTRDTSHFEVFPELYAGVGSYVWFAPTSLFRTYLETGFGYMPGFSTVPDTVATNDLFLKPLVFGMELNFASFVISQELYFRYYVSVFSPSLFRTGMPTETPRVDIAIRWKLP